MTTVDYLRGRETVRRRELWYGAILVREAAPRFEHQLAVTRLTVLLDSAASGHGLLCVSPVDVVLDRAKALVLQPDLVFVALARAGIIRDRIEGAPDLVVEVTSPSTRRRDRGAKLRIYKKYGVHECWLVDPEASQITCVTWPEGRTRRRTFRDNKPIESMVLGRLGFSASQVLAWPAVEPAI